MPAEEEMYREWSQGPRPGGPLSFLGLPETRGVKAGDIAIVGFPFDTGTLWRVGSRFGPRAIRTATAHMLPYGWDREQRPLFQQRRLIDYGDVRPAYGYMEDSFTRMTNAITRIADAGAMAVCLGGDHSISLPVLRALAPRHGKLSLLHFDSHPDFWKAPSPRRPYHHGSVFRVAVEEGLIDPHTSIQVGIRGSNSAAIIPEVREAGFHMITAREFYKGGVDEAVSTILEVVRPPLYISFDIDCVDPAFAPGTGAPEPGGLSSREALEIIRGLRGSGAVGFDMVEVSPPYDLGENTALLAATLIYEFLLTLGPES